MISLEDPGGFIPQKFKPDFELSPNYFCLQINFLNLNSFDFASFAYYITIYWFTNVFTNVFTYL